MQPREKKLSRDFSVDTDIDISPFNGLVDLPSRRFVYVFYGGTATTHTLYRAYVQYEIVWHMRKVYGTVPYSLLLCSPQPAKQKRSRLLMLVGSLPPPAHFLVIQRRVSSNFHTYTFSNFLQPWINYVHPPNVLSRINASIYGAPPPESTSGRTKWNRPHQHQLQHH